MTLRKRATGDADWCAETDRQLIDRCLAGEEEVWQELSARRHPGLLHASRSFLGYRGNEELAEEIAARVWFTLLRDGGAVLSRFDPTKNRDFGAFLSGMARYETLRQRRSERRRRYRETIAAQRAVASRKGSSADEFRLLREFMTTLSPNEAGVAEEFLLNPTTVNGRDGKTSLSESNVWQRRHRLRFKLLAYLNGNELKSRGPERRM